MSKPKIFVQFSRFPVFRLSSFPVFRFSVAIVLIILISTLGFFFLQRQIADYNQQKYKFSKIDEEFFQVKALSPQGEVLTKIGTSDHQSWLSVARGSAEVTFATNIDQPSLDHTDQKSTIKTQNNLLKFEYELVDNGIKESILLTSDPLTNVFESQMTTKNLSLVTTSSGQIVFYDDKGHYQFHLLSPFAQDATGDTTYAVKYQLVQNGQVVAGQTQLPNQDIVALGGEIMPQKLNNQEYTLVLEVDTTWMNDPERVYPILIDPTVVHDISSEFSSGQFNRTIDTGSGNYPSIESYYQELGADESVMALWHFNEGSVNTCTGGSNDVCDASGNGKDGGFNNQAAFSSTAVLGGYAVTFDGTADYISLGNNALNAMIGSFTIEAWVKTTKAGTSAIMGEYHAGTCGDSIFYLDANGYVNFHDGGSLTNTGNIKANDGNWHHVAYTYNGSQGMTYVDGIPGSSVVAAPWSNLCASTDVRMGGVVNAAGYDFNGQIDEVKVSGYAKTRAEILASSAKKPSATFVSSAIDLSSTPSSYNSLSFDERGVATGDGETASSSANLIAEWKFNETSGTSAVSGGSCGTSCNLTLSGFSDTTGQDTLPLSGWTANNTRWGAGGLMFDGASDYATNSDASLNFTQAATFTIEAWINPLTNSSVQSILSKQQNVTNQLYYGISYQNNQFLCLIGKQNVSGIGATSRHINHQKSWHHVTCLFDGTNSLAKIWVDGEYHGATAYGFTSATQATAALRIGSTYASTAWFSGVIDSVRIYDRLLPDHEIISNSQVAGLEFQTRTSTDGSSWGAWGPTSGETSLETFDNPIDIATPSASLWTRIPIATSSSTLYSEADHSLNINTGSLSLDQTIVGQWHLDETNGDNAGVDIFDETANSFDGEIYGTNLAANVTNGIKDKARTLNGTDDYIDFGDSDSFTTGANGITVSAWIKPTTVTTSDYIISKATASNFEYALSFSGTALGCTTWTLAGATQKSANSSVAIAPGKWHHIACAFDDTNNMQIYVNGVNVGSDTSGTGSMGNGTASLIVGKRGDGTGGFYDGIIDEIVVTNTIRSPEEINQEYLAGMGHQVTKSLTSTDLSAKQFLPFNIASDLPGSYLEMSLSESNYANYQPDSSTVGYWTFNETSGTGSYFKNSAQNSLHGDPTSSTNADGFFSNGQYFTGSAGNVAVTDNASLDFAAADNFTIEAWVRHDATVAGSDFIIAKGDASVTGYKLYMTSTGTLCFGIDDDSSFTPDDSACTTTAAFNNNTWVHVAGVKTGTTKIELYVNGVLVATDATIAATGTLANGGNFYIGADAGGATNYWAGIIDEVRLSNTARSATEIRQAAEIRNRTYPITIDFTASLVSGALIADVNDTAFSVDATDYGLSDEGDNLYIGDKIIVRETVDDTTYIAQGEVATVNSGTGAVTVSSWDSGSTFPSGGYTVNATAFKWQREMFYIDRIMDSQRNAITNLALRITDGGAGRSIYLDNLQSVDNYLSTPAGSTITSSALRYLQYRSYAMSSHSKVSPAIKSVTLDYTENTAPSAPTNLETEAQTNPTDVYDLTPEFSAIFDDANTGDTAVYYQILVNTASDFTGTSMWDSGQVAMTATAENSRSPLISYAGTALSTNGTTYYWKIKFWDDKGGEGTYSAAAQFTMESLSDMKFNFEGMSLEGLLIN